MSTLAERWQQWYPHHIDNWQGSANVQALSDLAYRAIHNLLQDMWKQSDCSLPNDDKDLAKRSRVAARWPECREEVMDYLELIDGKISNTFLKREWLEAQAIYAGRKERAKAVAARKKIPLKDDIETISKPHRDDIEVANRRSGDTVTETETETTTKKVQKPSAIAVATDPRHVQFRDTCEKYSVHKQVVFTWDGSEAKALDSLLKAAPLLTHEEFHKCLVHRSKSPGTPHGERPRIWLPNILKYQQGPLNEFNRTEEINAKLGNRKADSANTALARAQARAISEAGGDGETSLLLSGSGGGDGRDPPGKLLESSH